jgi:ATP-dependent protease ClpP protease subunit
MSAANLVLVAAQLRVADRGARFLLHEAAYERVTEQERYDAVRLRHMATAAALASSKMADTLAEHCVAPRSLIRAQMDKAREFGALTACWLGLTHFIAGGMDGLPVPRLRARA